METILVTDTQIMLGSSLAAQFIHEGWNVIAAPSAKPEEKSRKHPAEDAKKKNTIVVPWNRSSPFSCKNVLLQGMQRFSTVNAALILLPPLPESVPFIELKYLDIETVLDVWLKGSILLARDLLSHFFSRRGGSLAFVNLSLPKVGDRSLLDDLCREGMLVVFKHLAKAGQAHDVRVNAFLSRSADQKAYADFIGRTFLEKCNKTSGKLFYFQWK